MKTVYLKNGQLAILKEKIGDRFIINRINTYMDDDNQVLEFEGDDEIVYEIYENKPTAKIDSEILELNTKKKTLEEEILKLRNDKSKLSIEVSQISKTKVDSENFIINRSDILKAKSLALFPKDSIMPIIRNSEDRSMRGLKVILEISIADGKEKSWGHKLYYDYNDTYSQYLCEKHGILINPTQEEIDDVIVKRLSEIEFPVYQIARIDDKYLSENLLLVKQNYLKDKKETEKLNVHSKINELKEELKKLENNI